MAREELIDKFQSDLIDLKAMVVEVEGHDNHLVLATDMEEPPQLLHFIIPEYSTYCLTIEYRVKKRPLKQFNYIQTIKKHGVVIYSRNAAIAPEVHVNDDQTPTHSVTFAPEKLPGGMFIRGVHLAYSTFYEDDKQIFSCGWTIEIVKKHVKPQVGGYVWLKFWLD